MSEKNINFATLSILKGGYVRLLVAGFFYVCTLQIHGVTPALNVNASTAFKVESNGSVTPFFIGCQNKKLTAMLSAEKNKLALSLSTSAHETGKTFNFDGNSNVQMVLINQEPYFVAVDVCNVLGLKNARERIKNSLDTDEYLNVKILRSIQKLTYVQHTSGQQRSVYVVNESGLYALIMQSRKPNAKKFRKWVTSEVLPEIRKTGAYVSQKAEPQHKGCLENMEKVNECMKKNHLLLKEIYKIVDVVYSCHEPNGIFKNHEKGAEFRDLHFKIDSCLTSMFYDAMNRDLITITNNHKS